ncbi:MAG: PNGase F N-terminal domain-containing protein [Flavobacteriaceae bacterium]
MRIALTLFLVFWVGMVQAQKNYKITYERNYNGNPIENQDFIIVLTNVDATRITSEQILHQTKDFPYEETFIDRKNPKNYIQQAFSAEGKSFYLLDSVSLEKQHFEFFDEQKTILGYVCKKARTVINSNTIDLWFTEELGIKGSPVILGQNLGLILEYNRNGNFVVQATKIETPKKAGITPNLNQSEKVDNLTYRDLLWKSRFTTLSVFEDEIINFSDASKSNDSILRFANGTIALRKIKFDEIPFGSQIFVELTTQSNGDAYDRTGSVFVIPTDSKTSFLDALEKGIQELPGYTNGNSKKYQGVIKTEAYTPLVELMRFFTPFGIHHYNHIKLKNKDWHDKVTYRQDISELLPVLSGKEVYIGAFIGNYDKGGHKVSLNLTIHKEESQTQKKMLLMPLFNTTNVMEMAGQEYATMFDSEKGLEVTFTLENEIKNAQLRYITTGHGGWGGGDEFLPKKNTILLNGKEAFSFVPWRQDCGSYRLYNPASGNFNNGLSSSDYSRSNWCPGTLTNPIMIDLGDLEKGTHTLQVKIPQGAPEGGSFSSWNVSGILMGEVLER